MERPSGRKNKETKSPKRAGKAKKPQPVKVVYISNPTRVKATVHEFRSVVQELTGRDSDVADLAKYSKPADPPPPSALESPPRDNCSGGGGGGGGEGADLRSDGELGADCFVSVPEMLDQLGFPPYSPVCFYEPYSQDFNH